MPSEGPEEPPTAIVVAEPFDVATSFLPLLQNEYSSSGLPWALFPLAGEPLISWTLESLYSSGIQRIFIYIKNGLDEIQEWLKSSPYTTDKSPLTQVIVRQLTDALSIGDIMRSVDQLDLRSPFLFVQAGYIGNLDLRKHLDSFSRRKAKDPNLTMECLVSSNPIATCSSYSSFYALNPTNQVLHYQLTPLFPKSKSIDVPGQVFKEHPNTELRSDLDTIGVDIFSEKAPALFTENFDYQNIRPDFINGILVSDILTNTVFCNIIDNTSDWGAMIRNTRTYDSITKAVLSRLTYPYVPDGNMPGTHVRYERRKARLYLGHSVQLARSCQLGQLSLIGHNAQIGGSAKLAGSVIGKGCFIGPSCIIIDSHVMEGAHISEGSTIVRAIIGPNAVIGKKSIVDQGTIVGPNAVVGDGARLSGVRISREQWNGLDEGDQQILGTGTIKAFIWPSEKRQREIEEDDDDSDDEDKDDIRNFLVGQLGVNIDSDDDDEDQNDELSSISSVGSEMYFGGDRDDDMESIDDDDDDDNVAEGMADLKMTDSDDDEEEESLKGFLAEANASLDRAFTENHKVENAALELKTLRMAANAPLDKVRDVIVARLVGLVIDDATKGIEGKDGEERRTSIESMEDEDLEEIVDEVLEQWGSLLNEIGGNNEEAKRKSILYFQRYCATGFRQDNVTRADDDETVYALTKRLFPLILRSLYISKVVSDDAVFEWYKCADSRKSSSTLNSEVELRNAAAPTVKWIAENGSDDSEDDDSEEDSE